MAIMAPEDEPLLIRRLLNAAMGDGATIADDEKRRLYIGLRRPESLARILHTDLRRLIANFLQFAVIYRTYRAYRSKEATGEGPSIGDYVSSLNYLL